MTGPEPELVHKLLNSFCTSSVAAVSRAGKQSSRRYETCKAKWQDVLFVLDRFAKLQREPYQGTLRRAHR